MPEDFSELSALPGLFLGKSIFDLASNLPFLGSIFFGVSLRASSK